MPLSKKSWKTPEGSRNVYFREQYEYFKNISFRNSKVIECRSYLKAQANAWNTVDTENKTKKTAHMSQIRETIPDSCVGQSSSAIKYL